MIDPAKKTVTKYLGTLAMTLSATFSTSAEATCPTFHTLTNGTTADASQVMDNFNYVLCGPNLAGPVGIGTTGPTNMLDVRRSNNTDGDAITFGSQGYYMGRLGEDVTTNKVYLANTYGSDNSFIDFRLKGTAAAASKMIITGAGLVGIATTSPSYTLHVNGSVAGTSAYNNLSDIRLKKNVRPIINALSTVEKLSGVRFTWRSLLERDVGKALDLPVDAPQVGFIAQDVRAVLPEAVTVSDGKEAILSMQESKIVPLLVEAIKELKASNEAAVSKLQRDIEDLRRDGRDEASSGNVLHRVALAFGWR